MRLEYRGKTYGDLIKLSLSIVWALPVAIVLRLMYRWVPIRICALRADRIGHFIPDTLEHIDLNAGAERGVTFYWITRPCNLMWETVARRNLRVNQISKYLYYWVKALPGGHNHIVASSALASRDLHGTWRQTVQRSPIFTSQQENYGWSWLKALGWQEGEPFVCLLVRDSAYLTEAHSPSSGRTCARDHWAYHDYRDSQLSTYEPAVDWLANNGVWVFRMGKIMGSPMTITHSRVVDYAFREDRNDLLDLWLLARATACISSGTGPDVLAAAYGVPILFLNFLPLARLWAFADSCTIPKTLRWRDTGSELSLSQYLDAAFMTSKEYEESGIEIEDLSKSEILLYVKEFWSSLQQRCIGIDQAGMEAQVNHLFQDKSLVQEHHGYFHEKSRLDSRWLNRVNLMNTQK